MLVGLPGPLHAPEPGADEVFPGGGGTFVAVSRAGLGFVPLLIAGGGGGGGDKGDGSQVRFGRQRNPSALWRT